MQTSAGSNSKLTSLTTIESQLVFLATLLTDAYPDVTAIEGLDEDGSEVKVSVMQCDVFPVVSLGGSKTYRTVVRASLATNKNVLYKAAKWESVSPFSTSDVPNALIVSTATGT